MHVKTQSLSVAFAAALAAICTAGCSTSKVGAAGTQPAAAEPPTVAVAAVTRRTITRNLTLSSELVPFQEIDVYAKESGYIKALLVDYGSRVKKGALIATLEIPELEMQLTQDSAAIKNQQDVVKQGQHQVDRVQAQQTVYHLQYVRIKSVADSKPGLVAQQEVDDWQAKDLGAQAQLEAAKSALQAAESDLAGAQAKLQRDQVLFDYSKIYAPFDGVVTQRYANYGTLVQAGTSSATNVLPIVRLSQENLYRLVIPIPESYVRYIHIGDPVDVNVPSLNRHFPGAVKRFSVDVSQATRTMHTEVDVPNPSGLLIPGLYADANVTLERRNDCLTVPLQAVTHDANGADTVDIVTTGDRIAVRPIQLGIQNADWAEVLSGLNDGDRVVVGDRAALKPGLVVKPHMEEMTAYQPPSQ